MQFHYPANIRVFISFLLPGQADRHARVKYVEHGYRYRVVFFTLTAVILNRFDFNFKREFPAKCTFFLRVGRVKPKKYQPMINLPLISGADVDVPSLPLKILWWWGFPCAMPANAKKNLIMVTRLSEWSVCHYFDSEISVKLLV